MSEAPAQQATPWDRTVVAAISAIGTKRLGPAVMEAVATGTGADLCSAFALGPDGVEVLIAESVDHDRSPFARIASLRYAHRHWKRDHDTLFNLGRAHRSAVMARRVASSIPDMLYRRECYAEGAVGERLSLCRSGDVPIMLNVYRDAARDRFPAAAAMWIEAQAPMLIAAIERHRALSGTGSADGDATRRLRALAQGLSPREAEVLARTARGEDRAEIAGALDLSVTSVATYRQRGYSKLGIHSRAELRRVLRVDGC